jgi:hypothetical protein
VIFAQQTRMQIHRPLPDRRHVLADIGITARGRLA